MDKEKIMTDLEKMEFVISEDGWSHDSNDIWSVLSSMQEMTFGQELTISVYKDFRNRN